MEAQSTAAIDPFIAGSMRTDEMSPSRPFIERPVATSLLMLAIVLAGIVGFRFLPLSALPQVDFPTIQVQTLYPGASPEVMSQTVHRAAGASVRPDGRIAADEFD